MATLYDYLGWEELIFGAYLAVTADGEISTLTGTPGMMPVTIQRAVGNDSLPEVPANGMWVPVGGSPVLQDTGSETGHEAAMSSEEVTG